MVIVRLMRNGQHQTFEAEHYHYFSVEQVIKTIGEKPERIQLQPGDRVAIENSNGERLKSIWARS